MPHFMTTSSGLGLLLSSAVFLVTVILVTTRAIGFGITLLLLLFSLLIGVTVGNVDALRTYLSCNQEREIAEIRRDIAELKEKVDHIYREQERVVHDHITPSS